MSGFEILIGPSDWENHSLGKEGCGRYRIHNLPNCPSPGLYELGIAACPMGTGRIEKLDPESIVVVYLGQADNVRARLQRYGREGAHLENNSTSSHGQANDLESISPGKGGGLFKEIFSRGYSIVYRWAPMESKKIAVKMEAQLLNKFDYAWNKGSNGVRRPHDVLQKLKKTAAPSTTRWSSIIRKLQNFNQRKVGIKIEGTKPVLLEDGPNVYVDEKHNDFLSRIFKFGRSRPRVVNSRTTLEEKNILICGVALGDGSVCQNPAVERRKRCVEHKGMRVNGLTTRLILGSKSHASYAGFESRNISNSQSEDRLAAAAEECSTNEYFHPICGLLLDDGSLCRSPPIQGRKRCGKHKGKKTYGSVSKSKADKASQDLHNFILQPAVSPGNSSMKNFEVVCGVEFPDGSFCTRPSPVGRKRCEEHKGLRVNAYTSKLTADSKLSQSSFHDLNYKENYKDFDSPPIKYVSSPPQTFSNWNTSSYGSSEICGATISDGSFCKRQPVEGRKRCWQHKGKKAESAFSSFTTGGDSEICGVTLQNGFLCTRTPARGRKRCQQHKGRRI
ncbi:hypothetical protein RJ641_025944 [Dillenia turbinata]|uniref:Protein EFFECTOR OF TRANSCRIPTION 2-like n=1 Tax=Dillenia turbinata TaxID=194707 RepID=A0AAN8WAQ1_9MAGN